MTTTTDTTTERAAIIASMRDQLTESALEWDHLAERLQGLFIAIDKLGRVRWSLTNGGWLLAQTSTNGRPIGIDLDPATTAGAEMTAALDAASLAYMHPILTIVDAGEHFAAEAASTRKIVADLADK